jgi:hypothetical protein
MSIFPRCRSWIATLLAACLGSCTSVPSPELPSQYLDPTTAATVTLVGKPLVFYHEHPELAVHMRDYATVAAAAVDRQGKTDYVLIAYFWTTFDTHGGSTGEPSPRDRSTPQKLVLLADDRSIELDLAAVPAHDIGIGEKVHAPPARNAQPSIYRTDLATIGFLAAARRLELIPSANDSDSRYALWDDQRAALDAFVKQLRGEDR